MEDVAAIDGLLLSKKIKQQCCDRAALELLGHISVARAEPTAAAAVGKDHKARHRFGNRQNSFKLHRADGDKSRAIFETFRRTLVISRSTLCDKTLPLLLVQILVT